MRAWVAAAALLLTVQAAPALAADAPASPALQRCLDSQAGMTTMGQIQCLGAELQVQDARLNREYAKALKRLTPGQAVKFRAAQRAWVAFRDAECRSREDVDWGTMSRVAANACVLDMTRERADDVAAFPQP